MIYKKVCQDTGERENSFCGETGPTNVRIDS